MEEDIKKKELDARIATYKTALKEMVAINDNSYKNTANKSTPGYNVQYTKQQALDLIAAGNIEDLQTLSQYYWYSSGLYRNFVLYMSTMLTYDTLVVPKLRVNPLIEDFKEALSEGYFEALYFVDALGVPSNFSRITTLMIVNGAFYGLFREFDDSSFVVQDLPYAYCRTRFKNKYGNNVLEFDTSYFDKIAKSDLERKFAFTTFPKEFEKAYKDYKRDSTLRWFEVPDEMGMAFFYIDQKPMLISAIPAIIELEEYRDLEQTSDKQNLHKILTQKVPLNKETNEPILEMPEIKELHRGMVGMLKNTPNVDVLTTFNDIDLLALQDVRQIMKDNLEKMERSVYIDAGISRQIFNADGNLSLSASIKNDEAIVCDMMEEFNTWINYHINTRFAEKQYRWGCTILPISNYNRKEMHEIYLKNAEYGYSKFLPGIAGGTKQIDIIGTAFVEKDVLNLGEWMVPLQSSHTQSGDATNEGGRPKKANEEKSDKTIENIESGG